MHAITFEERYGLSARTENFEYFLHMTEDVNQHSLLDNYWCYLYERQVKYYKQQSSNMKSLCKTFADRAKQLHFTDTFLSTNSDANEVPDPNPEQTFPCLSNKPVLLTASSPEGQSHSQQFMSEYTEAVQTGIFLGRQST